MSAQQTIYFLHGWGLSAKVWDETISLLPPDIKAHCLHLPGYGISHNRIASTFQSFAEELADTLPQNAFLCGWSLGGMVALQAAALTPNKLAGIILVGSTPCFTQSSTWTFAQPAALLDSFDTAVTADPLGTLKRFTSLINQGDINARKISRYLTQAILPTAPQEVNVLATGLNWLRNVDLRPLVAQITTPTLLVHGQHDPLMPIEAAHWLNDYLANARLEIFDQAAHAPFLNDAEKFSALLKQYLHEVAR